jgi:hypothetical protein
VEVEGAGWKLGGGRRRAGAEIEGRKWNVFFGEYGTEASVRPAGPAPRIAIFGGDDIL